MSARIPVFQYTIEGEFVERWNSATEAWKKGVKGPRCVDAILRCCKHFEHHARGYRWLFESESANSAEIFKKYPLHNVKGYVEPTYTEEDIRLEASKYETKQAFRKGSPKEWQQAYLMGIMDTLPFKRVVDPYRQNVYSVYGYFFEETHSVYIGLTDDKKERDKAHRGKGYYGIKKPSAVLKHAKKYGLEIPDPVYFIENTDAITALIEEDHYKVYYKELGWNILNKAKTGLNSGSLGYCRKVTNKQIKDSTKGYTYLVDWAKDYQSYGSIARRRGIIKELGLKYKRNNKDGTFTEEYCYNIAAKHRYVQGFKDSENPDDRYAYNKACKEGWLKQYWWLFCKDTKPIIVSNGLKMKIYKSIKSCAKGLGCSQEQTVIKRLKNKLDIPIGEWKKFHYLPVEDVVLKIPDFEHRIIK